LPPPVGRARPNQEMQANGSDTLKRVKVISYQLMVTLAICAPLSRG